MSETGQVVAVSLRFEWGLGPFWITRDDGTGDGYAVDEIEEFLSLSDELLGAIGEWFERLQSTFDGTDPENMGFSDPEDERKWNEDGRELARRLKREVGPGVLVKYFGLSGPAEVVTE